MPSFLELLESADDGGGEPPAGFAPMDVLASVRSEGGRRRRRRQRRNVALAGLALVLVGLPVVAVATGGDDAPEEVRVADAPPNSRGALGEDDHDSATTTSTAPTEVLGIVVERPEDEAVDPTTTTTARPRPSTTATPPTEAPATEPQLVCANSTNPACGDFYWSPDPGNAPLTVTTAQDITLAPGEATTVVVGWSDADATLVSDYFSPEGVLVGSGCAITPRYGPWIPPAASGGSGTQHYAYTAPATPGDYTVGVSLASGDCEGPYRSEANVLITVHVA